MPSVNEYQWTTFADMVLNFVRERKCRRQDVVIVIHPDSYDSMAELHVVRSSGLQIREWEDVPRSLVRLMEMRDYLEAQDES
jgi:hypothetical protein